MNEETQHFTETGDLLEQLLTEYVAVIRADKAYEEKGILVEFLLGLLAQTAYMCGTLVNNEDGTAGDRMIEMLKAKLEHAEFAGNLGACMRFVADEIKNIVDIDALADTCARIREYEIKREAE